MEFESLLDEMEEVVDFNKNKNNCSKQALEQILHLKLNYLDKIYNNNYKNLLTQSTYIFELYKSLILQCNIKGRTKISYLVTEDNSNISYSTRDLNLNNYYGQINKFSCRKCNNFIHLKHSFWNDFKYNMYDFVPPPNNHKKKIFVFGWCRFNFNDNTALCPNCKKPHMNELLQESSYLFIENGINQEYLNKEYKSFKIKKIFKTQDAINASGTAILEKNSCFTIKLDDDKYFNDYKHWNIKTNKNKYYDCSVKESLKNENLINQIIKTNNVEEYFETVIDDNNNKDIIINNIFNENICSYIGIDFVKGILNLSTALGISLKKNYNKYYSYLFIYYNINYDLNYNSMMLNDAYKNLITIKKISSIEVDTFIDLNLYTDNYYKSNLFEYYPSRKLQYLDCMYCKKPYWFLEFVPFSNKSFIRNKFDKNKNMYNEMTFLKNKNFSCVCEKCANSI